MRRFTINCIFGGQKAPFSIYVGEPADDKHPLQNQSSWLGSERNGQIPPEIMESFQKLHSIAKENGVPFEDLCFYALGNNAGGQDVAAPVTAT
jgi:hypothetical protein